MVFNLFTSYNVIEARGWMLRIIKEKEKGPEGIKEHEVGVMSL